MDLAYERRGSGPPLVLLHALGADRQMWQPVLDHLAGQRDVVAVDLPGFGSSPERDGSGPPTPRALAAAVASAMEHVVGVPFHVAGNSLGGWVALEVALAGAASSVTAIGPAGLWPEPLVPRRSLAHRVARAVGPVLGPLVRTPRGRRLALGGTIARPERVPPAAALHLARSYGSAPGFEAVNDAMRAGRFTGLADIRVPVTLAWGEHDRLVAPPRRVPAHVRTLVLPGCGHLPTWDDPDGVAAVLLEGSSQVLTGFTPPRPSAP
jgi:pimeloyl-ACP methyl ester carboxylesterase